MSPLSVRRYRAERLLRREFEGLRGRVLASVRRRLAASGVRLDQGDLDACYAQAWQGLYTAVLDGQQIANPAGWLVLVTFRRAIEEHRARGRLHRAAPEIETANGMERATGAERDFADELDDRARLRQLFEGLRGRLDGREREAATLCYLQGLSRAEAAARLGVSEARMRKLMEGQGPERPGVAGKVGALVDAIRDGSWCEQQGSLMRAFAYGILDPDGERYQLALMHSSQCPACRAYVASLRGLAAVLPPVFMPWGLGAGVLARAGEGMHASGAAGTSGASGAASGGTGAGLQAGRGLGGALPASGAAGAGGAAGGGWLLGAGGFGAKLAVGCMLALGVGAGCVALDGGHRASPPGHRPRHASQSRTHGTVLTYAADQLGDRGAGAGGSAPEAGRASVPLTAAARASREFGPEQALASSAAGATASSASQEPTARSASSSSSSSSAAPSAAGKSSAGGSGGSGGGVASEPAGGASSPAPLPGNAVAAEREFAPG
ncbi:MAG TPA: sigma-70 family RNA polymerase sigma factor [Solirubrobacteraceae bacterium]|jgi:RNA polymerase sigma factor (sigma-70 family)|nr:sigma-70 family RNA polymerase sigma factor [Solirubrobacteraceae bacterium]